MKSSNSKTIEQKFLNVLPIINFLLSLLIVFHHGFTRQVDFLGTNNVSAYGLTTAIERFMYNLSECAVPIFFFLSAFLFYRTFDGTKEKYLQKMQRRIKSLLIPYLIFNTIGYVKALVFSGRSGGVADFFLSLLYSDTMPLWFIRELIMLSLLAPVIYKIKRSLSLTVIVCLLSVILAILGLVGYRCFVYWLPIYLAGAAFDKKCIAIAYSFFERHKSSMFCIFAYCLCAWFLPNGMEKGCFIYRTEFYMFRLLSPFMACFLAYVIISRKITVRKWMHYSFFVYCMHAPIITVVHIILGKINLFQNTEIIYYICGVFLSYALCVTIAMLMERNFYPIWKILNGNR